MVLKPKMLSLWNQKMKIICRAGYRSMKCMVTPADYLEVLAPNRPSIISVLYYPPSVSRLAHPPLCGLVAWCVLTACVLHVCCVFQVSSTSPLPLLPLPSPLMCGQALERQKEYFDCIRKERDELRDELADVKGKAKSAEVGLCRDWLLEG